MPLADTWPCCVPCVGLTEEAGAFLQPAESWVTLKHFHVLAGTEAGSSQMASLLMASAEVLPRTILVLPGEL